MKITKNQNIKISIIISLITMIISILVHFFYTPFLLDKIGDDQYGLYNFVTSTLSWLTVAVNAILAAYNKIASEEMVKDLKKGEEKTNGVYGLIVTIWAAVISLFAIVFILLINFNIIKLSAYNAKDQQTLLILFVIVAIQMVITVITSVANLNIAYNNHHIWIKTGLLIASILPPIVSIPFLLNGCNIITIVIIIVSTNIFTHISDFLFDRFILKKRIFVKPTKEITQMLKPVFAFCSIILINEIAYQVDCSIDNMVLGFKGYSDLITIYSLGAYIVNTAQTFISMIYTPLIPTIFKNESENKREKNKEIFDLITFAQLFIWILIAGGFAACGYYFTKIWVGEERILVFYICISLFIIRSFSACSGPAKDMMRAANKHKQRAILAVIGALINLTCTIILINVLDKQYAIWACIIGTAVSSIICWWIAANILNVKYLQLNIRKYLLRYIVFITIALISAVCGFGLVHILNINSNIVNLLIAGFVFVILFIGSTLFIYKKDIKKTYLLIRSK